jgi:cytochrome c oxidase assembly protein subunit 15
MKKTPTYLVSKLTLVAIFLAIVVVSLGAYTRLTHAGLGCPDWPGCYGQIDVPETTQQIKEAKQAFPEHEIIAHKAWNEMIHRYFAGSLGLLIFIIALLSLKYRRTGIPVKLPWAILALVVFQAALGMWTVTLKLMPVIVMAHLLGGFTTLCLLFLLYLRLTKPSEVVDEISLKKYTKFALLGIVILSLQIALGGWTSSNYAALTCTELPICQADWFSKLTFTDAFSLIPPEKASYEFGHLPHNDRLTIHVMHRLGAIITALYLAWLVVIVFIKTQRQFLRRAALLLGFLLAVQISLGISNVWFSLPLAVAVSHNIVAACLMLALIKLTYSLARRQEDI